MCRNTIVTIGDANYLWGLFMMVASARKAGMDEPFLVGTRGFTPEAERVLAQLGGVSLVSLDGTRRSLTCLKPRVMLQAGTEFVTWADSDAFFTGNVSELLAPANPEEIHFRLRTPAEMPGAFRAHTFGEDARRIPQPILDEWRRDVAATAGCVAASPRYATTGSAAFCSLSLSRHRRFLEAWDALQERVLPDRNVGVVDKSLVYYHQLDESTLNACLNFFPDAPRVQDAFMLNKFRDRLFVHFIAHPKPWVGWTSRAFRFFDEYVAVAEWAAARGFALPGPVPFSLKAGNKRLAWALMPWVSLRVRLARRLRLLAAR